MAETAKDVEKSPTQGLSVVDSLPTNSTTRVKEETVSKAEEDLTATEKLEVCSATTENAEVTEEDKNDDTIVLDENDRRDDRELNQATLIITTEDLLDPTTFDDTVPISKMEEVKDEKPVEVDPPVEDQVVKPKPKREDHGYFWVSNISRQVKAADLKKFFSQVGKVSTAKILTNGRNYYGYVSMTSPELSVKCIRQMNNTLFDGRKIVVSKDRPDLREKSVVRVEPKKKRRIEKVEVKKEEISNNVKATKPSSVSGDLKDKKAVEEQTAKLNSIIADLNKKLDRAKSDSSKYKFKVLEYQRRHEGMRKKCDDLERELKEAQYKMRNERRRLNQDREQFEKTKKMEQIRFDSDRAIINKELDEVRKLREHLREKIEEFKTQSKKIEKRRSRSPVVRERAIRGRSPPLRSNNAFRPEEKKRKREEIPRGRSPPPPPKLSDIVGKKRDRGAENAAPNRGYFGESDKRAPQSHDYEFRHKPCYGLPQDDRNEWPNPFPKDPRRVGSGPSSSQSYPPEVRYGGGYQFPTSTISGLPRSYYPEYGKSYGPY